MRRRMSVLYNLKTNDGRIFKKRKSPLNEAEWNQRNKGIMIIIHLGLVRIKEIALDWVGGRSRVLGSSE